MKEVCIFDDVVFNPCTQNVVADTMHDLAEGISPLETATISHEIILVEKLIAFDVFHSVSHHSNFEFQSSRPT